MTFCGAYFSLFNPYSVVPYAPNFHPYYKSISKAWETSLGIPCGNRSESTRKLMEFFFFWGGEGSYRSKVSTLFIGA